MHRRKFVAFFFFLTFKKHLLFFLKCWVGFPHAGETGCAIMSPLSSHFRWERNNKIFQKALNLRFFPPRVTVLPLRKLSLVFHPSNQKASAMDK
jgi:hypothetical protein